MEVNDDVVETTVWATGEKISTPPDDALLQHIVSKLKDTQLFTNCLYKGIPELCKQINLILSRCLFSNFMPV
jgi:hypothetical protein